MAPIGESSHVREPIGGAELLRAPKAFPADSSRNGNERQPNALAIAPATSRSRGGFHSASCSAQDRSKHAASRSALYFLPAADSSSHGSIFHFRGRDQRSPLRRE